MFWVLAFACLAGTFEPFHDVFSPNNEDTEPATIRARNTELGFGPFPKNPKPLPNRLPLFPCHTNPPKKRKLRARNHLDHHLMFINYPTRPPSISTKKHNPSRPHTQPNNDTKPENVIESFATIRFEWTLPQLFVHDWTLPEESEAATQPPSPVPLPQKPPKK